MAVIGIGYASVVKPPHWTIAVSRIKLPASSRSDAPSEPTTKLQVTNYTRPTPNGVPIEGEPEANNTFAKRLAEHGIGKKRTQKGTMYKGVGLKEEVRAKLTEVVSHESQALHRAV